ncbi:MAG: glutamate formimidoyltransferase, partial [Pyrinomonadaceae bacterium]
MDRLVECVPNFSEGRNADTIKRLVEAIESVASALVLDTHADADHNRSVVTFAAEPNAAVEAALRAARVAVEAIDLRRHEGQHPRVGALDVLPFVPLRGTSLEECARLAHEAGARIWEELGVPVYFYEAAARREDRARLEDVRRGGFERLREEALSHPERAPDVGGPHLHETAGACVVGARPLLVAYNINLRTEDVAVARRIARAVRGRDGGLRYLKALGFELRGRGLTQVSMNLVRHDQTTLHHAFAAVRREAERWGVVVAGSELVGLVPQSALDRGAEYFLQLENFKPEAVLENRLAAALERRRQSEENRGGIGDQ